MSPIDPRRWAKIAEILDRGFELPAEERAAFLDRVCADSPDLRPEVEALLRADSEAGRFLETPALEREDPLLEILASGTESAAGEPGRGVRVGPYRLVRELGRGGMGIVYLAERADGQFEQEVALKLVKRGMDSEEILRRFRSERQILARLDHPSIARLLDGGVAEDGRPYFALEYVRGFPITTSVAERGLSTDERVRLFGGVCAAVAYAQRNLIVHRDLKPSNILVNQAGIPKLLDFGIAKLLDPARDGEAAQTSPTGARPLTPLYAAPEQLRDEPVTTATDVYSLGIILFEILAGSKPFPVAERTPAEIRRIVLDTEPAPLPAGIPRDLAAIVRKAIRSDPLDRYPSAQALLDDLERYRRHLPVRALESSRSYSARKFVRRHRTPLIAAASAGVVLVAGLVATVWQARIAQRNAERSERLARFLTSSFTLATPDGSQGANLSAQELLARAARRAEEELAREPELQVDLLTVLSGIQLDWGAYPEAARLAARACSLAARLDRRGPALANALRAAGSAYLELGQLDRAGAVLQQALAASPGRSAAEIEARVDVLDELGAVAIGQLTYARAESIFRESLRLGRRAFRSQPLRTTSSMNGLAIALRRQRKLDEAEALYREALAIQRSHLPADHTDLAASLSNLATLLRTRGNLGEAESLVSEAVAMQTRLFGREHPDRANTLNELAIILREQGKYDAALERESEALRISRRSLGEEHPFTGLRYNELAGIQIARGDYAAADTLVRHAVRIYVARYGEAHERTFAARRREALVLREQGRFDEAAEILKAAVAYLSEKHGPRSEDVARYLADLGLVERSRGRTEDAEIALRRAIEIFDGLEEDSSPMDHATALLRLSGVLRDRGLPARADSLCRIAEEIQTRSLPPDHPQVATRLLEQGLVLHAMGRDDRAVGLLERAQAIRVRSFGSGHWLAAEATAALALALAGSGQPERAREELDRSLPILRAVSWRTEPTWEEAGRVLQAL